MDWTRGYNIGHGSSASVSLATDHRSGDVYAVKSVELNRSEFLQREREILSSISSPYVVSYKGCDITKEENKFVYNLFMEYFPDGTLTDEIRRSGGRLEESRIVNYTRQILRGLEYLHGNGLVHCDIKGRNILVGQSGAKIADFGCAKRVDPNEVDSLMPICGTPMYMAPEIARGEHQGFGGDIWAVGCTVIEMASGGATPWGNVSDPVSVLYRIGYSGELPILPCYLSEEARDFLDKCLRRDPEERWTAKQLLKHPFLEEYNSQENQNSESKSKSKSSSNSPTSILDERVWNSVEEAGSVENVNSGNSGSERMRRLSLLFSGGPSWDSGENWITVREKKKSIMDSKIEAEKEEDSVSDCVEKQESDVCIKGLLSWLDIDISKRSNNRGLEELCKYDKDRFVITSLNFCRDKDSLLTALSNL